MTNEKTTPIWPKGMAEAERQRVIELNRVIELKNSSIMTSHIFFLNISSLP